LQLGVLGFVLGVPDCYRAFSAMDWALPIATGRSKTQHFQNVRPGDLQTWKCQNLEKTRAKK